jgi:hypothetical protein
MAFVDWADQHDIILLILPPHTTHRLQPLSTYYSIDKLMDETMGTIGMTKGLFWAKFKTANYQDY